MKRLTGILLSSFVLLALMLGSAVAFAQDDAPAETSATPFIGIRYWHHDEGLFVTGIIPNTPAASVGLEAGDIVIALAGESIRVESVRGCALEARRWRHRRLDDRPRRHPV